MIVPSEGGRWGKGSELEALEEPGEVGVTGGPVAVWVEGSSGMVKGQRVSVLPGPGA